VAAGPEKPGNPDSKPVDPETVRRALGQVASLSALPAVWIGYEPQEIANDLVDVLMRAVNLDLIYLRLTDSRSVIEASRTRQNAAGLEAVRTAIAKLLRSDVGATLSIADSFERAPLRTIVLRSGGDLLVAASALADFPTDLDRLLLTVSLNQVVTALAGRRVDEVMEENRFLRTEIDDLIHMGSIVGVSAAMRSVLSDVDRVAPTEATVLITGETGTGKELIAREIHQRSGRANGPLIPVHAAGLASNLIASELFGHERGAFTGAVEQRLGRFELASKGTLFLDEIGELPPDMQVALLRVLQEHTFERVGGTRTLRSDARVIAATNRDLMSMIATGTFREDLYYRLNVFPIHAPPLRDRTEDILPLAEHFLRQYSKQLGKEVVPISPSSRSRLMGYRWPGNVRELQNVIERAVILARSDELVIGQALFPRQLVDSARGTLPQRVHELEKEAMERALSASKGRVGGRLGAAATLGMPPTTFKSKMRKLGIQAARFKISG
jgi:transcriptional regulator with GAF, ATPase, and Fis domain